MRVSLTDRCNLSCAYCVPEVQKNNNKRSGALTTEGLVNAVKALQEILQLTTIRLTGGEPLLYRELIPFIKAIGSMGIPAIKMTTNGYLLAEKAAAIREAGVAEINISIDALDPVVFQAVSRRTGLSRVLEGVERSMEAGLKLKINCVVMKGINDGQLVDLLRYARERKIPVRFLELMKMGHLQEQYQKYFFSREEILTVLAGGFEFLAAGRLPFATASYWEMPDGYQFGIIANESDPFCSDCNRLRLDSAGNIFGCLSSERAINIRESIYDNTKLSALLQQALQEKKTKFSGSKLTMIAIGG